VKSARIAGGFALLALAFTLVARAADFAVPPVPHRYVTDGAGVLDDSTRSGLEAELKAYEQRTRHQVIVWIGQTTGDVPLEEWTAETAHTWKIGRKGHDDGVVLFLFIRDHHVRIEVGYGLESALPDATAAQIIDEKIVPAMKADDPNRAVADGTGAILTTITPDFATSLSVATSPPEQLSAESVAHGSRLIVVFAIFFAGFVVMMIFLASRMSGSKGRHAGAGGGSFFSSSSSSDDSSSSSDDDFDSGGGDFGGGGASGSW
jgi:uncharacterized protein